MTIIKPRFVYGLILRLYMGITGSVNNEKYDVSQSGSHIIIDFPDRNQMVSFSVEDMVQSAYTFARKHPKETWDKKV